MNEFKTKLNDGTYIRATDNYVNGGYIALDAIGDGRTLTASNVTLADAHALADWIKANVPTPPKPTFQEQFDALPMGAWFAVGERSEARIKVSKSSYYLVGMQREFSVSALGDRGILNQINPEEVAK